MHDTDLAPLRRVGLLPKVHGGGEVAYAFSKDNLRFIIMRSFPLALALTVLAAFPALATMPDLTSPPKIPTEVSCDEWASNQDGEAISIWGIQEDGSTSRASALARLSASCQGFGTPEIVGFGTSAGFDEAYCAKHSDYKICRNSDRPAAASECVVDDPTPTLLNYRTAPYGRILGVLDNGQSVAILDQSMDAKGKPWVYIAGRNGKPLGWVYRSYIRCR